MKSRKASSPQLGTDQAHGLRRWWLDRSLRTKGMIVVAVPLIALLAITSANLLLQPRAQDQQPKPAIRTAPT